MLKTAWVAVGVLATILLGACADIDPAVERGVEERPPRPVQATLPREWTPMVPALMSPPSELSPKPSLDDSSALTTEGPWLLYCDLDGGATLMDLDGPGRLFPAVPCLSPQQVSGTAGFALVDNGLIQFPEGEAVGWACCDAAGWAKDGSLALLSNVGLIGDGAELLVYDVAADRFRQIVRSRFEITPMGLSPSGSWAVYVDSDELPEGPPSRQPPAQVMAVSTDGLEVRELFDVSDADVFYDYALGWLSESSLLVTRSDYPCNLEPQNLELLHADLNSGAVRHLFNKHSYAAFDPVTETVLLLELQPGPCSDGKGNEGVRLVRMTAADGWEPHTVALPSVWGNDWAVSQIEWHPELGQFSVRAGENRGGAPLHLITLDPDGTIVQEFPLHGAKIVTFPRLFPSPDGAWIVVGASDPHGTRLYDRDGRLIKVLAMEGGELSYGVWNVLWLPDGEAFFMTQPEGPGIFRAAASEGWEPTLVEPAAHRASLTLLNAPVRPFRRACGGSEYTRLHVGDSVVVSYEPPLSSRLRSNPGLTEPVVGMLEPGDEAEIVGGPFCGEPYVWWYLQPENTDLRGWAAEGDADGAWLLPVGGPPLSGTPMSRPTSGPGTTATPLPIVPLSSKGPWVIGTAGDEIRVLEADGAGLTRLPGYFFPHAAADLQNATSEMHSFIGLRNRTCAITECDYVLRIFKLPGLEPIQSIELLYPSLAWELGHGSWSEVLAARPPLMAVAWEGPEPALLWSPNGRYLAFVGAIDGPSADVYAFNSLTSEVLRLTDGPGQPVLMGWSPDSRWLVHMEAEFEFGEIGAQYDPIAVWAADLEGGPARYLYASEGQLGDSEEIVGWRSEREIVAVERDALGRMRRLTQVNVPPGGLKTLYADEVASAAVDPSSGTVAFVPYDPDFFPPQGNSALVGPSATLWASGQRPVSEGGIYLIKRGSYVPERVEYEEWYIAFASMEWIAQVGRFFSAWSLTLSFTAAGEVDRLFEERVIPIASPDGEWLVFRRPGHFPGISVYSSDGDHILEADGFSVTDVMWESDSSGFYLYGPEASLRFFSAPTFTDVVVHPDPGFGRGGSLRLVYP